MEDRRREEERSGNQPVANRAHVARPSSDGGGSTVPCTFCSNVNSVKHILTECKAFENARNVVFKRNLSLKEWLS